VSKTIFSKNDIKQMNNAMQLSLFIGFFMLLLKSYAYWITGSSAIMSDAAESIVHILAVSFAVFSMWLSLKPADRNHPYGHDRIAFFSAGFEGALIIIAAVFILFQSVQKFIYGVKIDNIDLGMIFVAIATILNGFLGFYLIKKGKYFHSLVLEADGKHILTDCLTSLGVILALVITRLTGWLFMDPLIAFIIGLNILWTGGKLIHNSIKGLMDQTDPQLNHQIERYLVEETAQFGVQFHHVRHRNAGHRLLIEVHLLFPDRLAIVDAHEIATKIERNLGSRFSQPTEIVTHLEPLEGHDEVHQTVLGREG
jgi:cation diffusion facilitator family transporter